MRLLLLLLAFAAACGPRNFAVTKTGSFDGRTMVVLNLRGNIYAYAPAFNQPADTYTVTQTTVRKAARSNIWADPGSRTLTVCPAVSGAPPAKVCPQTQNSLVDYVVRVPKQARVTLSTVNGAIHVTDVPGPVDARAQNGDIKIQIPSYANAATQNGNVTVMFGDARWPGTLHFSAEHGDVEVWVPATADTAVDLHTDHGTIFTDFDLRGSSNQAAETIVGKIGNGGDRRITVRVTNGSIRLLKLTPQM